MSTLKTAPPGRLPVLTTVMARKDDEVVDAIARECARGGQVFYVVPRIEMIQRELALLQRLLKSLMSGTVMSLRSSSQGCCLGCVLY